MKSLCDRISKGLGEKPADIVLRGGRIFDLITGQLLEGDVAICDDTIVGICDKYDGSEIIEVDGAILVPGFIDTHLHIESSMVTPFEFDRCVTPRGVTTAICDPHEIANVLGVDGIRYFQKASELTLMDIKVQISPCVPSTDMETSGARLTANDLKTLLNHQSNLGLAEVMNYPGVVNRDPEILAKILLFKGGHIDGHAPLLSGKALNAYIAAGICTEHESTSPSEALEKLQKGMRILIREGSVSKDLHALHSILNDNTAPYICLCTDDRNPLDIGEQGHIDYMIRELIELGVSPLSAYRSSSLSAAEAFGLKDRGLIAPGKRADIAVIGSLKDCNAELVFCAGKKVTDAAFVRREVIPEIGRRSIKIPNISAKNFRCTDNSDETNVIGIIEGKIITEHIKETISIKKGDKIPDSSRDLIRIAIIERHGKNGNISTGFVRGFGLKSGAIASSVAHDHHNVVVVGIDYEDMAIAVNRLHEIEGGFVVASHGSVLEELALPLAGLMSLQPFEQVKNELVALRKAARSLGVVLKEPFLQLSFLALPVIPSLKITDRGLVDVTKFEIIS